MSKWICAVRHTELEDHVQLISMGHTIVGRKEVEANSLTPNLKRKVNKKNEKMWDFFQKNWPTAASFCLFLFFMKRHENKAKKVLPLDIVWLIIFIKVSERSNLCN